jgi:hypothetical protein
MAEIIKLGTTGNLLNKKTWFVKIMQDEDADSPDSWGNDDLFVIYNHRQFTIKRDGFDCQEVFEFWHENNKNKLISVDAELYNGYLPLPLYAYIHSGVALSLGKSGYPFSDPWDTSFKGFVMGRLADFNSHEHLFTAAQSLVKEWNTYLSGDVYGFQLYTIPAKKAKKLELLGDIDEDLLEEHGEEQDSCWGFYGSDFRENGMLEHFPAKIQEQLKIDKIS